MLLAPVKTKRPTKGLIDNVITRQAPTRGWNARDPEAAMKPGYALVLDNFWPSTSQVELRKGAQDHVTGFAAPVKSIMAWNGASSKKLFCSTDAGIYDVTAAGAVGAVVSALTNGSCISADYTTTGGSFMFVVNGVDSLRYYDGATWTTVATFSINGGGTLTTTNIININVFKRSLFFIEKSSMSFFYLSIDTIAGNVSRFPLGGLFAKGGHLVAMGTWTIDGGSGVDDFAAFVTSEGQVAVYKGTDPSSATTWALQGVFDLGAPIGLKCMVKFGGDLLYLSRDGLYPLGKTLLSTTVNKSQAISDNISFAFSEAARVYGLNSGWTISYSISDSLLLVNVPTTQFSKSVQFAMNTINKSWCRLLDWDAFCFEILDNQIYMGMAAKVAKAWIGFSDFGGIITAYAKPAFDYLGFSMTKHVKMIRPVLKIQGQVSINVSFDTDFADGSSYGPTLFSPSTGALFDTAQWVATGGSGSVWAGNPVLQLSWVSVSANPFFCAAPRLRVLANNATVGWSATDYLIERGQVLS